MKILELFAGSRSIGKAAEELGHEVFSSDITDFGGIDYVTDIFKFDLDMVPFVPDMIWASPPCTGFSVAAIGKNWVKGDPFTPKTDSAHQGVAILLKTIEIIRQFMEINPSLSFYIENPRGKMRKAPFLQPGTNHGLPKMFARVNEELVKVPMCHTLHRHTVTYCQYGDTRMKPTDIWTNNANYSPRPACKNGAPCHVAAPRGSQTGTQGLKGNHERSKIPHDLCLEVIRYTQITYK